MELPIDKIAANVARVVRADTSPAMDVEIEAMIDLCEHAMPHDDWASIRRIDFSAGLPKLKSWCQRTLSDDPPKEPIRGMYFSLCHPCDERRDHVYLDLEMVGTSSYSRQDTKLEWLFSRNYFPREYAKSRELDELYGIAHRSHSLDTQVQGALTDAEYPIGLLFSVIATRLIFDEKKVPDLPTDSKAVGIVAGWGDGDLVRIGEVTNLGFEPNQGEVW